MNFSIQAYVDEQRKLREEIGRLHWQAWQLRLEHKGRHYFSACFHRDLFWLHDSIRKREYRIRSCELIKTWIRKQAAASDHTIINDQ